ncbi:hypothetical protein A5784_37035 [Mycobacterium sp. 852013-50091_SCH5140682]|uniref:hypothetical protein n=1 Tax=Mycobacterium sp. 852013-50091_SCH5140682 TaxID=1834109 RepID=UPI0007EA8C7E|nr:hypothetical protein [Mycobacterium sp. 852013-50091_SCH5140682]OBC10264.1 hypothetical protein A5784_37035 [Mycobacterium sp. 852013-50091_SCH5140682]
MSHRELLPVPPIETATDPIHSTADLRQRWRALMGELGFGQRLLWVGFVGGDRRMYKTMSQVPLRAKPQPGLVEYIVSRLPRVLAGLEDGATVALLLTRPGRGPVSNLDRDWASLLTTAAVEYGVPLEPIFRANDEAVLEVEPTLRLAG